MRNLERERERERGTCCRKRRESREREIFGEKENEKKSRDELRKAMRRKNGVFSRL